MGRIAAFEGNLPDCIEYDLDGVPHSGYTLGDRIIETWFYWRNTGDYPWPESFSKATAVDVEELTHLNNAFQEWSAHFARQKMK